MQHSIDIASTPTQHFTQQRATKEKRAEVMQEKLRRLRDILPPNSSSSSSSSDIQVLRAAVRHLQQTRTRTPRSASVDSHHAAAQGWTQHHSSYTAGYGEGVKDVNNFLAHSQNMSHTTRSNIANFIGNRQDYNNVAAPQYCTTGFPTTPTWTQQHTQHHRYNFVYSSAQQHAMTPNIPAATPTYTYWKPW